MTPEERKAAFIDKMAPQWANVIAPDDDGRWLAAQVWNGMLAYFDTQRKPIADAIRYDLATEGISQPYATNPDQVVSLYRINYPADYTT